MSQSTLQFTLNNSKTVNLYIQTLTDDPQIAMNEKNLIPDPTAYRVNIYSGNNPSTNRVLIHGGYTGRKINISGHITTTDSDYMRSAYLYGVKVYPTLYPPPNGTTAIKDADGNDAYYITKYSTTYKVGTSKIWFDLEITSHTS